MADLTSILKRVSDGDREAEAELLDLVYVELRRMARSVMRSERPEHTLEPTALVHEVYLRLMGGASVDWTDRIHFFHTAARMMRRILKDQGRAIHTQKRFGGSRIDLDDVLHYSSVNAPEYNELSEALDRLEVLHPRQCMVVELKYIAGLTTEEIAAAIGKNVKTVQRDWDMARIWLREELAS